MEKEEGRDMVTIAKNQDIHGCSPSTSKIETKSPSFREMV
jgi:hypothetical protein